MDATQEMLWQNALTLRERAPDDATFAAALAKLGEAATQVASEGVEEEPPTVPQSNVKPSPFRSKSLREYWIKSNCKPGERSDLTGCTPASGEVGTKKPKKAEQEEREEQEDSDDGEEESEPLPEWDGEIEEGRVSRNRHSREHITTWTLRAGGDYYEQNLYVVEGEYDPFPDHPDSEPIAVYRWESVDAEDGSSAEYGDWVADRDDAVEAGEEYAEDNNEDEPEEEEPEEDEEEDEEEETTESELFQYVDGLSLGATDNLFGMSSLSGKKDYSYEDVEAHKTTGVRITITHPDINRCERFIATDDDGDKFMYNEYLILNDSAPKGSGINIFSEQVENAAREGFAYIRTHAAGDYSNPTFNGYYTWPRFGYDMDLEDMRKEYKSDKDVRNTVDRWDKTFPDAASVLDIMAIDAVSLPDDEADEIHQKCEAVDKKLGRAVKKRDKITGADWWLVHGCDLFRATFDLTEGSRSRQVLEAYMSSRGKK